MFIQNSLILGPLKKSIFILPPLGFSASPHWLPAGGSASGHFGERHADLRPAGARVSARNEAHSQVDRAGIRVIERYPLAKLQSGFGAMQERLESHNEFSSQSRLLMVTMM